MSTTKKIESNYSYLYQADVVDADAEGLRVGNPRPGMAFCIPGRWMTAMRDFHLRGGWGGAGAGAWRDDGAAVAAGQRFRLVSRGSAACASVWEVED